MEKELEVRSRKEGSVGVLETDGYINNEEAEKVGEAGKALINDGLKHLVLNLEKSPIANSIGISILIEIIEKVRELEGKVAFCCVRPILAKTLRIMGLLKVAEIYETEEEAIKALQG